MEKFISLINQEGTILLSGNGSVFRNLNELITFLEQKLGISISSDLLLKKILSVDRELNMNVPYADAKLKLLINIKHLYDENESRWLITLKIAKLENSSNGEKLLLSNTNQSICLVNKDGMIVDANEQFKKLALNVVPDYNQKSIFELLDAEYHNEIIEAIEAAYNGISKQLIISFLTHLGRRYFLQISTLPQISDSIVALVYCIVEDITASIIEKEDKYKAELLIESFHNERDYNTAINNLLKQILVHIKMDVGEFWLIRQDNSTHLVASDYPNKSSFKNFENFSQKHSLESQETETDTSAKQNSVLFFNDSFPRKKQAIECGIQSGFSVPVIFQGKRIAVFTFLSIQKHTQRNGLKFVKLIAQQISYSLAYRRSYESMNELFELIPDMVCLFDRNGNIIKGNKAFHNYISADKKNIEAIAYKTDVNIGEVLNRLGNEKIIENLQFRIATKDDLPLWTEWSLTFNKTEGVIYAVVSNIQLRKLYDLAIRADNEKFYLLGKSTQDLIYEKDLISNKIDWGDGFSSTYEKENDNNSNTLAFWEASIDDNDKERVFSDLKMTLYRKKELWTQEYKIITAQGKQKNILDRGTIVYQNEKAIKIIGMMQDISALKKNEELLTQLNDAMQVRAQQLSESNKELESFAYIVSHDLQEPLRMISSFLKLLIENKDNRFSEKEVDYINFALDGAERMKRMINDLLTYARVGTNADDFTIVDLDEVREEVERNFKSSIISGNLIIESEKLPAVSGVKTQLIQLFANIVSNAIKYNEAKVKKVVITKSENEKEWIITIADNGIGIDEKHRNDIYLLFKRLHPKSKYSGTGIGLAVCKKIIQRHQGRIWLEANPEGGSMFRFALPKTSFT